MRPVGETPPPEERGGAPAAGRAPLARPDLLQLIEQLRQAGWYVMGPAPDADDEPEAHG